MNNYNDTFTSNANKSLIPTEYLPSIFRLMSINHKKLSDDLYMHTAEIFHENKAMTVAWINEEQQYNLTIGLLVTPQWACKLISNEGQVLISNLTVNQTPTAKLNIFETVPHKWVQVPSIIKHAKSTFEDLPADFKLLFNAIFWEGSRFYRYLVTPHSLNQEFSWHYGNIMHAIVVAKSLKALASGISREKFTIMTLAALLNDAGKADDYILDEVEQGYKPSTRMLSIGSKVTIFKWISTAIAKFDISMNNEHYLLLMHILTASNAIKSPLLANDIRLEYKIFLRAKAFSKAHANFHKRPRYMDQGIKVSVDKMYFI